MTVVNLLGLGCAFLSAAGIAVLAVTDPKRSRGAGRAVRSAPRTLLWLAAFAPGVALGAVGRWTDFLIWIGAAAILGWAAAALSNVWLRPHQKRTD